MGGKPRVRTRSAAAPRVPPRRPLPIYRLADQARVTDLPDDLIDEILGQRLGTNRAARDYSRNLSVARVKITNLKTGISKHVHVARWNLEGGRHAEPLVLERVEILKGRHRGIATVEVTHLYSERIPCGPGWSDCQSVCRQRQVPQSSIYYSEEVRGGMRAAKLESFYEPLRTAAGRASEAARSARGIASASRLTVRGELAVVRAPQVAPGSARGKPPRASQLKPTVYHDPAATQFHGPSKPVREAAEAAVGKRLARFLLRLLPVLDLLMLALDAIELIGAINSYFREKAIEKAYLAALRDEIPKHVEQQLKANRVAIAGYYVKQWTQKSSSALFLYVSPRVEIYNAATRNSGRVFDFKVSLNVKRIATDLVSVQFIPVKQNDINDLDKDLGVSVRWSFNEPLLTPFDIFLARIELLAAQIVDDWLRIYSDRKRPASSVVRDYHELTSVCAIVMGTLKFETYFGFRGVTRHEFDSALAAERRREELQGLASLIKKKAIPILERLPPTASSVLVRTSAATEVETALEPFSDTTDILESFEALARDMRGLDTDDLGYRRFDALELEQRIEDNPELAVQLGQADSLAYQIRQDLAALLAGLNEFLPASLKPESIEPTIKRSDATGGQVELDLPAFP